MPSKIPKVICLVIFTGAVDSCKQGGTVEYRQKKSHEHDGTAQHEESEGHPESTHQPDPPVFPGVSPSGMPTSSPTPEADHPH